MGEVQWIKLYIDMFDKRKIKKVRRLPAGNDLLLIWIMLLAMAGKCNAGGMIYITENVPFTEEDLADELDFEVNTIRLALKAFEELNMITTTPEGIINILGWEEYQNIEGMDKIREQNRIRQKKWYDKQKALTEPNAKPNVSLTQPNAIEEEGEIDKEKESHSFTLSGEGDGEPVENSDSESLRLEYLGGTLGAGVVLLSKEQFADLCDRLSLEELNKYIGIVRDCELNGKPYTRKTHYQAILDMVEKDRRVKK